MHALKEIHFHFSLMHYYFFFRVIVRHFDHFDAATYYLQP